MRNSAHANIIPARRKNGAHELWTNKSQNGWTSCDDRSISWFDTIHTIQYHTQLLSKNKIVHGTNDGHTIKKGRSNPKKEETQVGQMGEEDFKNKKNIPLRTTDGAQMDELRERCVTSS